MAYHAKLINRHEQHGRVSYDLVVEDDEGLLPTRRSSVSWPAAADIPESDAVLAAAVQNAMDALRDEEIEANIRAAIEQKDPTFRFSTPAENAAAIRAAYKGLSSWDAVRMGNYIASLELKDAQITNLFGFSGQALANFKNKLAASVTIYKQVLDTLGS